MDNAQQAAQAVEGEVTYHPVDASTGEIIPILEKTALIETPYRGISELPVTPEQAAVLRQDVKDEWIDIKPTGEIYAPHDIYRKVLCDAFSPAGWGIVEMGQPFKEGNELIQKFAMYVGGRYVASAYVGAIHYEENKRSNWADTLEGMKSDFVRRACKDLGVFLQLWDKDFCRKFLREKCVKVDVWYERQGSFKADKWWRRIDGEPFLEEDAYREWLASRQGGDTKRQAAQQTPVAKPAVTKTLERLSQASKAVDISDGPDYSPPPKESVKPVVTNPTPTAEPKPAVVASAPSTFPVIEPTDAGDFIHEIALWNGAKKPANGIVGDSNYVVKFTETYVGKAKGDAEGPADDLDSTGKWNPKHLTNHLRTRFKVDFLNALTWEKFNALVKYTLAVVGDERGGFDPKYYADKIAKAVGDTVPEVGPITAEAAKTDPVAITERWNDELGVSHPTGQPVSMVNVIRKSMFLGGKKLEDMDDGQRHGLWLLMDAVKSGAVQPTENDIVANLDM